MKRIVLFLLLWTTAAEAVDTVVWQKNDDSPQRVSIGRTLVLAQDRGLLFQERSGEIFAIEPQRIRKATRNEKPFVPMTSQEIGKAYLQELPEGFEVLYTPHYTIFHDTTRDYARWCGILMEKLYTTFANFWKKRGYELPEPEFPLVIVLFSTHRDYRAFAKKDVGEVGNAIIGYYSYQSNRVVCYDLSGQEKYAEERSSTTTFGAVTREILSRPDAAKQVATIIHEATHQLVYNRGLAVRYGDVPLWYNEGIALYFESPNLKSEKGWQAIGKKNPLRYPAFQEYLARRPENSLRQLLSSDDTFRDVDTAGDAYAESWALTWFLLRARQKAYIAYARHLAEKKALLNDTPEERIQEFERFFGSLEKLDRDFVRYMKKDTF
ncbi:MAG: DUF1570 domain-containing protein [Planctomycetia bacterium]|nr:DUF1570 domain-containing protein [Planctomycetia bacterium]